MPNHVINRLSFDCSEERLKQILSEICYDDSAEVETTGIGTIDFNKITPMPPSLDIEDGSNTNHGIANGDRYKPHDRRRLRIGQNSGCCRPCD